MKTSLLKNKKLLLLTVSTVLVAGGSVIAHAAPPLPAGMRQEEPAAAPAPMDTLEAQANAISEQEKQQNSLDFDLPPLPAADAGLPVAESQMQIDAPAEMPALPALPGTEEAQTALPIGTEDEHHHENHQHDEELDSQSFQYSEGEVDGVARRNARVQAESASQPARLTPPPLPGTPAANNQGSFDNLFGDDTAVVKPPSAEETAAAKAEEEAEKARLAEEAKKAAEKKKVVVSKPKERLVPLPKEYRLPGSIYKREYDVENRHLPAAKMESDYDAQLFLAIGADDVTVTRSLLSTGRSIEMRTPEGDTPLTYAVRTGSKNVVRMLIGRGADVNANGSRGVTPLQFAMLADRQDLALALLSAGADPNTPDINGNTPLMQAVLNKNHAYTVALIQRGAFINMPTLNGRSAVHVAAENNQVETLVALIQGGGDVNMQDSNQETPLMLTARSGARESARVLLRHGADPLRINFRGVTAATIAKIAGNVETMNTIMSAVIRQELEGGNSYSDSGLGTVPLAAAPQL